MSKAKTSTVSKLKDNQAKKSRLEELIKAKYIHTPVNQEFWELLEDLMLQVDPVSVTYKVDSCYLVAPPHAGKTTCVKQFRINYIRNERVDSKTIRYFELKTREWLKGMLIDLAMELKVPDVRENCRLSTPFMIKKIAAKLKKDGTELLIIDEFQYVLKMGEVQGEQEILDVLAAFNCLSNLSNIPVVLVGINGIEKILALDNMPDPTDIKGSFSTRYEEYRFRYWNDPDDDDYLSFLVTLHDQLKFRPPDGISPFYEDYETRKLLLELTKSHIGKIVKAVLWSARYVIRKELDEIITRELLEKRCKRYR
jgi:hypothetical protein